MAFVRNHETGSRDHGPPSGGIKALLEEENPEGGIHPQDEGQTLCEGDYVPTGEGKSSLAHRIVKVKKAREEENNKGKENASVTPKKKSLVKQKAVGEREKPTAKRSSK